MTFSAKKTRFFFTKNGIDDKQAEKLLSYAQSISDRGLPIIYEVNHLSSLLGVEASYLYRVIHSPHSFYRTFSVDKNKGGRRTIQSPYPQLAYIQSWINKKILNDLEVSDASYAYRKGVSILDNANYHLHCKEFFKTDIKDFFSSISIKKVQGIFENCGYSIKLSYQLACLCCYYGTLPQGAPTSPKICNLICKGMDSHLLKVASEFSLKYTRYADDLCFSGNEVTNDFIAKVMVIISEYGFEKNPDKTFLKKSGQRKIITGLCISGDKVRVQKKYRREFRKKSHYLLMNKEKTFNGRNGMLDPFYLDKIIGQGNFILFIEPDNAYVNNILPKIYALKKELLIS